MSPDLRVWAAEYVEELIPEAAVRPWVELWHAIDLDPRQATASPEAIEAGQVAANALDLTQRVLPMLGDSGYRLLKTWHQLRLGTWHQIADALARILDEIGSGVRPEDYATIEKEQDSEEDD